MSGRRIDSEGNDQGLTKTAESVEDGGIPSETEQMMSADSKDKGGKGPIPIEALNVGYSGIAMTSPAQRERPVAIGNLVQEENSNDGSFVGPVTPQRLPDQTPEDSIGTPLTPLANLKVLIAAASSALEREKESAAMKEGTSDMVEEATGRKMKSLSLLCKKFLSIVESDVGTGSEFSLDMMAQSLGTNRRRIYDIINVMEALEMIVKQSKNWYTWLGRANLIQTLAKLRAMALDDPDFKSLFLSEETDKENRVPSNAPDHKPQDKGISLESLSNTESSLSEGLMEKAGHGSGGKEEAEERSLLGDADGRGGAGRWDKSLGVLCQKFVMLFLVSPNHEMTLECAGSVLMPDDDTGNPFAAINPPAISKSKVRRLYDIANVLMTLGLIKKKTFMAPNHRKMPGYTWCGPSLSEIESVSVCRRNEFGVGSLFPKKKGGITLTRKPSFGNRPFLHQYEVKSKDSDHISPDMSTSTPSTPTKTRDGGFRRSLSFGAPAAAKPPCVVARPLSQRQLDYMHEVKEFEAEMQKHSYRYPHASVFHEFIQKYQSTLEQAASSGRTILPKPLTSSNVPNVNMSPSLGGRFNPADLVKTLLSSSSPPEGSTGTLPATSAISPEFPANIMSLSSSPLHSSSVSSSPSTGFGSQNESISSQISPNQALPADKTTISATICAAISSGISPTTTSKSSKLYRKILPAPLKDSSDDSQQNGVITTASPSVVPSSTVLPHSSITSSINATTLALHEHREPLPVALDFVSHSSCLPVPFPSGRPCIGPLTTTPAESALTPEGSQSSCITTQGDTHQVATSHTSVCMTHGNDETTIETVGRTTVNTSSLCVTSSTAKPSGIQSAPHEHVDFIGITPLGNSTNLPLKNIENDGSNLATSTIGVASHRTTHGTLRSPPKSSPARSRSFISVEEFLTSQRSRKATSTVSSISNQDTPLLLQHQLCNKASSSQFSPPTGVQPLPVSGSFSKKPVAMQPMPTLSMMVNQTPIPSACEHSQVQNGVQSNPQVVGGGISHFGIVNPNLFLTNPSSPLIALQSPFFTTSGAVYPVNSTLVLPPVSALLGSRVVTSPAYLQPTATTCVTMATTTIPTSTNDSNADSSPPKRPRLE